MARRSWIRAAGFVGLCVLIALGWRWFAASPDWHPHIPTLTRSLEPLYVVDRPTDITAEPARTRFVVAIACVVVGVGLTWLSIARRWPAFVCLVLAVAAALAINVSVARVPLGYDGLTEPFSRRGLEYFPDVRFVRGDPIGFIERYPALNLRLAQHSATHPPGAVLFLYFGGKAINAVRPATLEPTSAVEFLFGGRSRDVAGGASVDAASWLAIGVSALALLPAYWIALQVGGRSTARRALPLFLVVPNVVTFGATSMDGVFLTFLLAALGCGLWAMKRWSALRIVTAGLALWVATFLTYTSVVVPTVMGAYALAITVRRPLRGGQMLLRCVAVGIAFIAFQALAHWLLHYDFRACVEAAIRRDEWAMGSGYETLDRYRIITACNLLAVLLGAGVATTALTLWSVVTPSWRRSYAFALATFLSVVGLSASTLFTLEAERVLLVFAPLLLIGTVRVIRGWPTYLGMIVVLIGQALWIEVNYRTYW